MNLHSFAQRLFHLNPDARRGPALSAGRAALALLIPGALAAVAGCAATAPVQSPPGAPGPSAAVPAETLTLYSWEDDIPQSVLDAFTAEYGVAITYQVYESQEEAIDALQAGDARCDVVVMEGRFIPLLTRLGLLAEIDRRNVPNFKNISAGFRNLVYDPGNRYTIPYNWGTTGLVVRSDLVPEPVTRWADLWDARYAGKVAIWAGEPRDVIAFTLKALGYSANSEDAAELEAALQHLVEIKPRLRFLEDFDLADSSKAMASGQVWISMGYARDAQMGRALNPAIAFVYPEEGALMWGDTFVIPAASPRRRTAELFLNFVLRPDISARMINESGYPMASDAATSLIDPDLLNDRAVFPHPEDLQKASLILPLSPEGQERYNAVWQRFLAASGPER